MIPTDTLAGVLLDERSTPTIRTLVGTLLSRAHEADFAIARIRLGAVDLTPGELASIRRCRVLLGRLDVQSLTAGDPGPNSGLDALVAFLGSGRVEVRSAGAGGWTPDFSIFRGLPRDRALPAGTMCLIGAHSFWAPQGSDGPAFTALLPGPSAAARASARFEELWARGYDVLPILLQTVAAVAGPPPARVLSPPATTD